MKTAIIQAVEKTDQTDRLINFLKEENEKARQHELKLFLLMFGAQLPQQSHVMMKISFKHYTAQTLISSDLNIS